MLLKIMKHEEIKFRHVVGVKLETGCFSEAKGVRDITVTVIYSNDSPQSTKVFRFTFPNNKAIKNILIGGDDIFQI